PQSGRQTRRWRNTGTCFLTGGNREKAYRPTSIGFLLEPAMRNRGDAYQKAIHFWFLPGLFMRASPKSLPLCYMIVTNWATHKMKSQITISTQRHRDTEFLFFSVSLCLCVVFIYGSKLRNYLKKDYSGIF
ncbi:MAG: hypothetical protein IKH02_03180, partial [Prevotella sp.]|nr:hypothetical protein [Prevotella sp.]